MGASVTGRELEQYLGFSEINGQSCWTYVLFTARVGRPYGTLSISLYWGSRGPKAVDSQLHKGSNVGSTLSEEINGEITSS